MLRAETPTAAPGLSSADDAATAAASVTVGLCVISSCHCHNVFALRVTGLLSIRIFSDTQVSDIQVCKQQ